MIVDLFEWADDGGPGGRREVYEWRETSDGQGEARPSTASDDNWTPWPKSYIQIGPRTWAKYWRYCVHAPGDPLFETTVTGSPRSQWSP